MENSKKLSSLGEVLNSLKKLKHQPDKKLGQNFLVDENILNFIIDASDISDQDTILEIGPGLGALTEKILLKSNNLVCVEKDKKLYSFLLNRFSILKIINKDILKINPNELAIKNSYKIISNLPYSVASRIIIMFAESNNSPISKGLTEKIVFIPEFGKLPRNKEGTTFLEQKDNQTLIHLNINLTNKYSITSSNYDDANEIRKNLRVKEDINLFYVAISRSDYLTCF